MLLVIYLKSIFKNEGIHMGNKFLGLVLLNSLMRTHNQFLLNAVEVKLLRRLYIMASSHNANKRTPRYSQLKATEKKCAEMFHHLLR